MYVSIQKILDKVGLPLIVTEGQPNLCLLLDTGATHNILFSFVLEAYPELFNLINVETSITGIEGTIMQGKQVNGTIRIDEEEIPVEFLVVKATSSLSNIQKETGIQVHGILGIPFLTKSQCILDFKELTISN